MMEQLNLVDFCEDDKESSVTNGPIQSFWYLEDTKRIFLSEEKAFVWYKTWNFNKIQDFLCTIVKFLFLLKEYFFFFVDFSRQYSVKHLFELRREGLLKYSLCQKKGASVLCVTYYCKKIKKYVCKAILFFFLSGLEPLAFFSFVFCYPVWVINKWGVSASRWSSRW